MLILRNHLASAADFVTRMPPFGTLGNACHACHAKRLTYLEYANNGLRICYRGEYIRTISYAPGLRIRKPVAWWLFV